MSTDLEVVDTVENPGKNLLLHHPRQLPEFSSLKIKLPPDGDRVTDPRWRVT